MDSPPTEEASSMTFAKSIILATFSFLLVLLVVPPLTWHARNRNIGATVLVACTIYANLQTGINALIWPTDDFNTWYRGVGLCDVEVKLQVFVQTAVPASICCILAALARVMDTDRASWAVSDARRRRGYVIDGVCCLGLPSIQMLTHYIVQPFRYYIMGMTGCMASVDNNWVSWILMLVPPLLWTLIGVYYSILVIIRLIRYRLSFQSILAGNNITKSRFLRLYALCIIYCIGYLPVHFYIFYRNISQGSVPFSWKNIHSPTEYDWNAAVLVRSEGRLVYDRWVYMAGGIVVFILFGFGKDALKMYHAGLLAIGADHVFLRLRADFARESTARSKGGGGSSKTNWSFLSSSSSSHRKSSLGSPRSTIKSFISNTDVAEGSCPKQKSMLATITECQHPASMPHPHQKQQRKSPWKRLIPSSLQKTSSSTLPSSPSHHISPSQRKQHHDHDDDDNDDNAFILSHLYPQEKCAAKQQRMESHISAEPVSPSMACHIRAQSRGETDVLIRKEVRQESERVEVKKMSPFPFPTTAARMATRGGIYEGV